jgi:Fur family peroxide stress response transcriptional regulator
MAQQKYSRQRESIRENLRQRADHPTADMVYSDIRLIFPNISLGTVYRNLSLLAEQKELRKIVGEDGVLHFDCDTRPHSHFICRKCGRVMDMPLAAGDMDEELIGDLVDESFKGHVDECSIVFFGSCEDCCGE